MTEDTVNAHENSQLSSSPLTDLSLEDDAFLETTAGNGHPHDCEPSASKWDSQQTASSLLTPISSDGGGREDREDPVDWEDPVDREDPVDLEDPVDQGEEDQAMDSDSDDGEILVKDPQVRIDYERYSKKPPARQLETRPAQQQPGSFRASCHV